MSYNDGIGKWVIKSVPSLSTAFGDNSMDFISAGYHYDQMVARASGTHWDAGTLYYGPLWEFVGPVYTEKPYGPSQYTGWKEERFRTVYILKAPNSEVLSWLKLNATFTEFEYALANKTVLDADLTAIADAIRVKKNTTDKLEFASQFVLAIRQLSTVSKTPITITPSSTSQKVTVPTGYDGVSDVTVSAVPLDTTNNTATANGTFNPSTGKFFNTFKVNIPIYDGTVE